MFRKLQPSQLKQLAKKIMGRRCANKSPPFGQASPLSIDNQLTAVEIDISAIANKLPIINPRRWYLMPPQIGKKSTIGAHNNFSEYGHQTFSIRFSNARWSSHSSTSCAIIGIMADATLCTKPCIKYKKINLRINTIKFLRFLFELIVRIPSFT